MQYVYECIAIFKSHLDIIWCTNCTLCQTISVFEVDSAGPVGEVYNTYDFTIVYMHAKYNCHTTKLIYQSYTQCTHVVPIFTSGMVAHTLTDCSRGRGEEQGEEEEKEDALLIL